jgi:hypothetical protein
VNRSKFDETSLFVRKKREKVKLSEEEADRNADLNLDSRELLHDHQQHAVVPGPQSDKNVQVARRSPPLHLVRCSAGPTAGNPGAGESDA